MALFSLISALVFFGYSEWIKALVFFTAFFAGFCISSCCNTDVVKRLVFFAVSGFSVHLLLLAYLNIMVLGHMAGDRTMVSPWTGHLIAVTLVGLNSCVPIAYSFYCFFCQKKQWLKIFGLLILLLVIIINSATATRTPFILMGFVYLVMFYVLFKSGDTKRRAWLVILGIAAVVVLVNVVLPRIVDSAIGNRFADEELQTSRIDIMGIYLEHMWEYPFGGGLVQKNYHRMAHNVIQESYDFYGIFFEVLFIFVFIGIIKRTLFLYRLKPKSSLAFLLICLNVAILPQLLMEPVIQGYPQLLWFMFLMDGVVVGFLHPNNVELLKSDFVS